MKLAELILKKMIREAVEDVKKDSDQKDSWQAMNALELSEYMQALRARVRSEVQEIERINQRLRKLGYTIDGKH